MIFEWNNIKNYTRGRRSQLETLLEKTERKTKIEDMGEWIIIALRLLVWDSRYNQWSDLMCGKNRNEAIFMVSIYYYQKWFYHI